MTVEHQSPGRAAARRWLLSAAGAQANQDPDQWRDAAMLATILDWETAADICGDAAADADGTTSWALRRVRQTIDGPGGPRAAFGQLETTSDQAGITQDQTAALLAGELASDSTVGGQAVRVAALRTAGKFSAAAQIAAEVIRRLVRDGVEDTSLDMAWILDQVRGAWEDDGRDDALGWLAREGDWLRRTVTDEHPATPTVPQPGIHPDSRPGEHDDSGTATTETTTTETATTEKATAPLAGEPGNGLPDTRVQAPPDQAGQTEGAGMPDLVSENPPTTRTPPGQTPPELPGHGQERPGPVTGLPEQPGPADEKEDGAVTQDDGTQDGRGAYGLLDGIGTLIGGPAVTAVFDLQNGPQKPDSGATPPDRKR